MKIKDIIRLAFDSVFLYKFRSFLSILGITIGVAAVISGIILGIGNRELIMEKLARGGADALWFYKKTEAKGFPKPGQLSYQADLSITKEDVEYIKKQCSLIKDITPYLLSPAVLRYGGKYHTIKAVGFLFPKQAQPLFGMKMAEGRAISALDVHSKARVCVIEKTRFAYEAFKGNIPLGEYVMIGEDKYKIIGTTEKLRFVFGYPERLIAIFPSTSLQEAVGTKKYSAVEVSVRNVSDVPKVLLQLKRALAQRFGYPLKFHISTFSHIVQTTLEIINLMTTLIIGIAIISLSVAGVGIMNVMMTMVTEQTREIGIAKAIGAKKRAILFLFIAESTILTSFGGILGILLALGSSKLVSILLGIPLVVPVWVILLGFSLSIGVGVVSGAIPAKRAAELDPAITLRQL